MKADWTGEWQPNNMTTVSYIVTRIVIYIIANIWNFSNLRQAFPYGKKYHVRLCSSPSRTVFSVLFPIGSRTSPFRTCLKIGAAKWQINLFSHTRYHDYSIVFSFDKRTTEKKKLASVHTIGE